jgi:hypothetical protein
MTDAAKLFSEVAQPWLADPVKLIQAQGELFAAVVAANRLV